MKFLLPLLFSGVGVVFFVVLQALRSVLAWPFPRKIWYQQQLEQTPNPFLGNYENVEVRLRELGFSKVLDADIMVEPVECIWSSFARFYIDATQTILVQVGTPVNPEEATSLALSVRTQFSDGTILTTLPGTGSAGPVVTTDSTGTVHSVPTYDLAVLIQAHRTILVEKFLPQKTAQVWSSGGALCSRLTELANLNIAERIKTKALQPTNDGYLQLSWYLAIKGLWHTLLLSCKKRWGNADSQNLSKLSPEAEAYFYALWQRQQLFQPSLFAQLGFFVLNSLIFMVLLCALVGPTLSAIILGVLLLHEVGRYLALRVLGYGNITLSLIPLIGGVVTYFPKQFHSAHQVWISLMGPLPGILLGWILLYFIPSDAGLNNVLLENIAFTLLFVNYFNLLPFLPLDGGKILSALVHPRRIFLWVSLELSSVVGLGALTWWLKSPAVFLLTLLQIIIAWKHLKKLRLFAQWGAALDTVIQSFPPSPQMVVPQAFRLLHKYLPEDDRLSLSSRIAKVYQLLTSWQRLSLPSFSAKAVFLGYFALLGVPAIILGHSVSHWDRLLQQEIWTKDELAGQEQLVRDFSNKQLLLSLLQNKLGFLCHNDPSAALKQASPVEIILRQPAIEEEVAATEMRLHLHLPKDYRALLKVSNGLKDPLTESYSFMFPVQQIFRLEEADPELVKKLNSRSYGRLNSSIPLAGRSPEDNTSQSVNIDQLAKMLLVGYLPDSANPILLDAESSRSGAPWTVYVLVLGEQSSLLLPHASLRALLEEEQLNGWTCVETERRAFYRNQRRLKDSLIRAFLAISNFLQQFKHA